MHLETVRKVALRLPHVTEQVQWGDNLVFKVGGKMFLVLSLEPDKHVIAMKVSDENFVQLQETDGIFPAPYLARAKWLAFTTLTLLRDDEFVDLIKEAHRIVFETVPRKVKEELLAISKKKSAARKTAKKAASKTAAKKPRKRTRVE